MELLFLRYTVVGIVVFASLLMAPNLLFSTSVSMVDDKITLNLSKVPLKEALEVVKSKSGYGFLYNSTLIDNSQRVSVNLKNATLKEVLNAIFAGTSILYRIEDNQIILYTKEHPDVANSTAPNNQQEGDNSNKSIVIRGRVVNRLGSGIPGASVMVKGTTKGVATDSKGYFLMKVSPKDSLLAVYFVGYKPVTYPLNAGNTEVTITMDEEIKRLDEVVVTGYQRLSKERATGSFVTVNTKHLESKLQPNLTQVLEGQIAGLTNNNGRLEIRGRATLSANSKPLIVVDGYPYEEDLSTINTNNIENITILKDAVAASIYGARSSNGVIVVTTKTGGKEAFSLSYEGTVSFRMKNRYSEFLRGSTSDYIDGQIAAFLERPYFNNGTYNSLVDQYMSEAYFANRTNPDYSAAYAKIAPLRSINAYDDIFKYVHRVVRTTTHNIGIKGGSEKASYNLALKYTGGTGNTIKSGNDRITLDVKNVWRPKKWLSFDVASYLGYSTSTIPSSWDRFLGGAYTPYLKLFDESGNPQNIRPFISEDVKQMIDSRTNMNSYEMNPIRDLAYQYTSAEAFIVRLTANAVFKITDGLTASVGGVYIKTNANSKATSKKESFTIRNLVNNATDIDNSSKKYFPNGDMYNASNTAEGDWTMRAMLNFNRSLSEGKHIISALAGYEVRKSFSNNDILPTKVGYNPIAGSFVPIDNNAWNARLNVNRFINSSAPLPSLSVGEVEIRDNRYVSYFGNGSYEYNKRYIISGSARLDLTNFFGTDPKYRYKPIWSIGGTWKLSNEEFFKVDFINRLHIRGSYGINGNISLAHGPFLIIRNGKYNETAKAVASDIESLPNSELRWEKTTSINGGFDITFFKNRLDLSVDFYNKLSTDLLANDDIDPTAGFERIERNVGSVVNRGIEVNFNGLIVDRRVKWISTVNFSYNYNKILKYNVTRSRVEQYYSKGAINREGYTGNALFGYRFVGLNSNGQPLGYTQSNTKMPLANLLSNDLIYQGTTIPPYSVSFTNQISYKNFELSFMLIGRFGAKYRKDAFYGTNYDSRYFSYRWKKPGDELTTIYPAFSQFSSEGKTFPYIDALIGSANYVKLRDVMLNYTLPDRWAKATGLSRIKTFFQARNLYTFKTKGVDVDPETGWLFIRPEFYLGLTVNF